MAIESHRCDSIVWSKAGRILEFHRTDGKISRRGWTCGLSGDLGDRDRSQIGIRDIFIGDIIVLQKPRIDLFDRSGMDRSSESIPVHRGSIGITRPEDHDLAWSVGCKPSIPRTIAPIGLCIRGSGLECILESRYIEFGLPSWYPVGRIGKDFP